MNRCGVAFLVLLLWPAASLASQQGTQVMKNWQSMDTCARKAHEAFPDYTPDSNAKRDAKLSECLQGLNMPAREPLSPPQ